MAVGLLKSALNMATLQPITMETNMKEKQDDGGPAYPFMDSEGYNAYGMTLLDHFAGLVISSAYNAEPTYKKIAKEAYDVAEAMIAEKRRREG